MTKFKGFYWKRPWCWKGLGAGGEGDDRGWDGWMASPTRWTWVWVNSRSWWWTGRPGMLWFMGSQRVGHDWATELTDCKIQNILMHLKCVHSHGDTMEIKYFILWLVPEHLSSESFIHSILYTFLLDIFPCSALHFFFFPIFFFLLHWQRYQFPNTSMHICNCTLYCFGKTSRLLFCFYFMYLSSSKNEIRLTKELYAYLFVLL